MQLTWKHIGSLLLSIGLWAGIFYLWFYKL